MDAEACAKIRSAAQIEGATAGVIWSNELLDELPPVKLRYAVLARDIYACASWQEVRIVHVVTVSKVRALLGARPDLDVRALLANLHDVGRSLACAAMDSSVRWEDFLT